MPEEEVGKVTRFFAKVGVAGILVEKGRLKVGDTIHIKGHTTDFQDTIASLELANQSVDEAKPGDEIGVKLKDRARPNDAVFRVIPD